MACLPDFLVPHQEVINLPLEGAVVLPSADTATALEQWTLRGRYVHSSGTTQTLA